MPFIRRIPVAMSALALGLAALGNLLAPYSPEVRLVCGAIAAICALLLLARLILDFAGVRAELKNPAALAVAPAFPMALMLLATYLKPYAGAAAFGLWAVALALQLAIVALFIARLVTVKSLAGCLPSWFLIFVGYVVGAVTSPAFEMQPLGRVLLYAGVAGYLVALPLIVLGLRRADALPAPALPTMAIFAAPSSLCLVGYLAVTDAKQAWIVYVLLAISAISLVYVFTHLPGILKLGFHPGFAALTFPFVITAIALKQSGAFLAKSGAALAIPSAAIMLMDAFAAVMVVYVLARYVMHLARARG